MRVKIKELLTADHSTIIGKTESVKGWVKTLRSQKNLIFVELNDGSIFSNLQVIIEPVLHNFAQLSATIASGVNRQGIHTKIFCDRFPF